MRILHSRLWDSWRRTTGRAVASTLWAGCVLLSGPAHAQELAAEPAPAPGVEPAPAVEPAPPIVAAPRPAPAPAAEQAPPPPAEPAAERAPEPASEPASDPTDVRIHAFVSQGVIKTTGRNYLTTSSKRGSVEFSEVGLNFTSNLSPDLRVGVQVFAHELGPLGNYTPTFDWYYLDYRFRDWLGVRAGRTKIPFGLYNDSADVDAARVPILLPQSVYPIDHRDYLLAQNGAELYGNQRLGPVGQIEYRAYGGTLNLATPTSDQPGITVDGYEMPYVYGGRLLWLTPLEGLTAAASYQALRFDWDYHIAPELIPIFQSVGLVPPGFAGTLPVQFRVKLWVTSLEYQSGDLTVAAEYSRWIGSFDSQAPALLPPHVVNERYYGMVSYHVTPWFTPGAYYSVYYENVEHRDARKDYQRDLALSVRFDLTRNWLLKLEGHWMNGTLALEPSLNDGTARQAMDKNWSAFLAKTTAYF